ncbi:MAG TPA: hypothetical protein VJC03_06780 [bacterium]|nr:hypothetical protein [bacterium]
MKKAFWLFVAAFFGVLFFMIWEGVEVVNYGYRMNRLRREITQLREENAFFREEYCRVTSLKRIEEVARTKLGMKDPATVIYVSAKTDRKLIKAE